MLHHRKANRLKGFDYTGNHLYSFTSCVQDRYHSFGEILRTKIPIPGKRKYVWINQMELNECGHIAWQQWFWLARQYPYVLLHDFIVMPNHVHGIIEINRDLAHSAEMHFPMDQVGIGRDLSL